MLSKFIGLEINTCEIKFVELKKSKNKIRLGCFGRQGLQSGTIEGGMIKKPMELKKSLAELRKKIGRSELTVSFFPDQTFLTDILSEVGFKDVYFESVGLAISRLLPEVANSSSFMLIYFGSDQTEIYVVEKKEIEFLTTLSTNQTGITSLLAEKIDEQFISWHTCLPAGQAGRTLIQKIFLTGELPELPRLAERLGPALRVPVEVLEPWQNLVNFDEYIPEMTRDESFYFAVPLGLAYRKLKK